MTGNSHTHPLLLPINAIHSHISQFIAMNRRTTKKEVAAATAAEGRILQTNLVESECVGAYRGPKTARCSSVRDGNTTTAI